MCSYKGEASKTLCSHVHFTRFHVHPFSCINKFVFIISCRENFFLSCTQHMHLVCKYLLWRNIGYSWNFVIFVPLDNPAVATNTPLHVNQGNEFDKFQLLECCSLGIGKLLQENGIYVVETLSHLAKKCTIVTKHRNYNHVKYCLTISFWCQMRGCSIWRNLMNTTATHLK